MKERKNKHIDDVIEDYLTLTAEQLEVPLLISKALEKSDANKEEQSTKTYTPSETDKMYKLFSHVQEHEARQKEISEELAEVEKLLYDFLTFLKGGKISYKKKGDTHKAKSITYEFWLDDGRILCNR